MNKNLLRTLFLTAALAIGTASFAAVGYVTTTTNSSDETKRDVTYTFNDASNFASSFSAGSTVGASVYKGSTSTDTLKLYVCDTEGLERLAFNAVSGINSFTNGQWVWRTNSSSNYGLQLRGGSTPSTSYTGGFAILDLKAGDVVTINGANFYWSELEDVSNGMLYTFPGASEVNGTEQTPNKMDGEATYTVTGATSDNTTSITINVTEDGYVASFAYGYAYKQILSIVITEDMPAVDDVEGEITAVSGVYRTISLTCSTEDVTIYYTTDGTTPTTSSTVYESGITISETTTISAIAVNEDGDESNVYSATFEAGVEVSLADIEYSITTLDKSGSSYYPSYSFSCDNSDVLLAPDATLSATYEGEEISDFDGTFEAYGTGTLVVTATADGYADVTLTIEITTYSLTTTSTDYSTVSGDDIELGLLGDGWTVSTSATRWSSWSKTAGVDTDLEANGGSSYYEATNESTSVTLDDFVTFENSGGVVLLIGYGIGSNARANYARISDAEEGSVAAYSYYSYGTSTGTDYVAYTEDNTDLEYTISRYSQAVYKVQYYTANASTSTAIQNVAVESAGSSDAYYTLQGIKVQNPSKGLYIQNGKKVIIK